MVHSDSGFRKEDDYGIYVGKAVKDATSYVSTLCFQQEVRFDATYLIGRVAC